MPTTYYAHKAAHCPDCGSDLAKASGCTYCPSCGYSPCR